MQVGGGGSLRSEINVTPLVDVVLVLLIIFMVITPVVQMGYLVRVPPKAPANLPPSAVQDQIILRLMPNNVIFINKEEVPEANFPGRIRDILHGNTHKSFPGPQKALIVFNDEEAGFHGSIVNGNLWLVEGCRLPGMGWTRISSDCNNCGRGFTTKHTKVHENLYFWRRRSGSGRGRGGRLCPAG